MNAAIDFLNLSGNRFIQFAWPMLWQSTSLAAVLFAVDFGLRKRIRPATLHLLWLLLLVKLVLPPGLAVPCGAGWWLRPGIPALASTSSARQVIVTYGEEKLAPPATNVFSTAAVRTKPALSIAAWCLVFTALVSLGLMLWMTIRWRAFLRSLDQAAEPPEWLARLLEEAKGAAGLKRRVGLGLVQGAMSPAVCGLWRPTVLVPEVLVKHLTPKQLRGVLLHELHHIRRCDVWVQCAQTLLQIAYWWHPIVWLANARMRRVREEAVDEAVMLGLADEADEYAPTLLKVARMALARPLSTLGLVGIFESQGALKQRVERLLEFRATPKTRLRLGTVLCILAFGAVAVPMGEAPAPSATAKPASVAITAGYDPVKQVRLLYESGNLEEADRAAKEGLRTWPTNQALYYYANLILEARQSRTNYAGLTGRKKIIAKLEGIKLDEVRFENLTLAEVARQLSEMSAKADLDRGNGVPFFVDSTSMLVDNVFGPGSKELSQARVRMASSLRSVSLHHALEAVVMTAEVPIRYSIEDYAVVFAPREARSGGQGAATELRTRIYKFSEPMLARLASDERFSSLGVPQNSTSNASLVLRFLKWTGVDLSPPKAVFYTEGERTLMVRGSPEDIGVLDAATESLNVPQVQINIRAQFIEAPDADAFVATLLRSSETNQPGSPVVRRNITDLATPAQTSVLLKAVDQNTEIKVMSISSITTLPGRQSQMSNVDLMNVLTNINPKALVPPGISNEAERGGEMYVAGPIYSGPVLDVVPWISADGRQIELSVKASVKEFGGYQEGAASDRVTVYVDGKQKSVSVPKPVISSREMEAHAVVPDGHSLVMVDPDPAQGRRNDGDTTKRLIVVLTPTMINADGTRVHAGK